MNDPRATLPALLARMRQSKRIAIFTHLRPDPDALGSQAAAALILSHLGAKQIHRMQFADAPPPYRFLHENLPGELSTWNSQWVGAAEVDTILLVDTCTYAQLEPAQEFLKSQHAKIVAIDHHLSRDPIGPPEFLYTDHTAASCAEVLWQLAALAGVPMSEQLALPLFAGLVGDTGWFRFDSVTARSHQMAADLSPFVNPAALYERLMQNETRPKLALMQRALAGLRWSGGANRDRFAAMLLRHSDFTETGATPNQTEYLVDMPLIVSSVEVVALLTEMSDGRIRCSLRSKHGLDVNKICNQFSGGGHAKAAGCRLDGPLDTAYERLAAVVHGALG